MDGVNQFRLTLVAGAALAVAALSCAARPVATQPTAGAREGAAEQSASAAPTQPTAGTRQGAPESAAREVGAGPSVRALPQVQDALRQWLHTTSLGPEAKLSIIRVALGGDGSLLAMGATFVNGDEEASVFLSLALDAPDAEPRVETTDRSPREFSPDNSILLFDRTLPDHKLQIQLRRTSDWSLLNKRIIPGIKYTAPPRRIVGQTFANLPSLDFPDGHPARQKQRGALSYTGGLQRLLPLDDKRVLLQTGGGTALLQGNGSDFSNTLLLGEDPGLTAIGQGCVVSYDEEASVLSVDQLSPPRRGLPVSVERKNRATLAPFRQRAVLTTPSCSVLATFFERGQVFDTRTGEHMFTLRDSDLSDYQLLRSGLVHITDQQAQFLNPADGSPLHPPVRWKYTQHEQTWRWYENSERELLGLRVDWGYSKSVDSVGASLWRVTLQD